MCLLCVVVLCVGCVGVFCFGFVVVRVVVSVGVVSRLVLCDWCAFFVLFVLLCVGVGVYCCVWLLYLLCFVVV